MGMKKNLAFSIACVVCLFVGFLSGRFMAVNSHSATISLTQDDIQKLSRYTAALRERPSSKNPSAIGNSLSIDGWIHSPSEKRGDAFIFSAVRLADADGTEIISLDGVNLQRNTAGFIIVSVTPSGEVFIIKFVYRSNDWFLTPVIAIKPEPSNRLIPYYKRVRPGWYESVFDVKPIGTEYPTLSGNGGRTAIGLYDDNGCISNFVIVDIVGDP